jgi:glutamine synthetase
MIRVPERRGAGTRFELRTPDPSANPYLALTVMLAAGLDGIATEADWREPVNTNIWEMSHRERRRLRVDDLPQNLSEACDELERNDVLRAALGEHVVQQFLAAKREEWRAYSHDVSTWELDRYLGTY